MSKLTEEFWTSALKGEFALQRCRSCQHLIFYPRIRCPVCHRTTLEWEAVEHPGTVLSATRIHRAPTPAWQDRTPYTFMIVEFGPAARVPALQDEAAPPADGAAWIRAAESETGRVLFAGAAGD